MPRRGLSSCVCQHEAGFLCNPILVFVAQAIIEREDLRPEKEVVLRLCDRDAISEAKKALWKASDSSVIGKMTARRASESRPREQVDFDDIAAALIQLAKTTGLPDAHLSVDDAGFYAELCVLRAQAPPQVCTMAQDKIVEMVDAVSTLTTAVADMTKELSQLKQRADQAECPAAVMPNHAEIIVRTPEPSTPCKSSNDPPEQHQDDKSVQIPMKPMPMLSREEPFQFQRRRRGSRGHRRGIPGCGDLYDGSGFRAADENLFIYHVSCDTNSEDIRHYIERLNKSKGLTLTLKRIGLMSHLDARMKSLKMPLPSALFYPDAREDVALIPQTSA
jgi:hypothetical protein